jgi:lysophospholipase L1-like esterase
MSLLNKFLPSIPAALGGNPVWEISLNSEGFRNGEFPKEKPPSAFRIICLGDSWTFGANVGQEEAYPQRLGALLRQEFPAAHFEVFNLGVLGYSSYQGLELLRRKAIEMAPDLLVIAFAMNDSSPAGFRDKDVARQHIALSERIGYLLEKIEGYKLLRYVALVLKDKPKSIGDRLKAVADSDREARGNVDYEERESWTRVSPRDYKKNIREMIDLARRRDADAILLYSQLSEDAGEVAGIGRLGVVSPYRMVLEEISREEEVRLVDSSALITSARRRIEEELEAKLSLRPHRAPRVIANNEIEVIFRVYLGEHPVPKAVYIVGAHPKLGDLVPNKVVMYDDGTHGDHRAGDNVWSYSATFPPGTNLLYVYTNSGKEGKWEGLDVPYIRRFKVEVEENKRHVYRPVESFGKIYMQADAWHTNADGYEIIAKALLEVLKRNEKLRAYLRHVAPADRS